MGRADVRARESAGVRECIGREHGGMSRLFGDGINIMESLILAQNERWRRVLSMQVERQQGFGPVRVANG